MRTIKELLTDLSRRDIRLRVEDQRLLYDAPKGKMTPGLRRQLKERKQELIEFLNPTDTAKTKPAAHIEPTPDEHTAIEQPQYHPLSGDQQRLFHLDQSGEREFRDHLPGAILIEGELSVSRLKTALTELLRHHPPLRSSFHLKDGQLLRQVHPRAQVKLTYYDNQTPHYFKGPETFLRPFDLSQAPLLRLVLIKEKDPLHKLLFDMHAISPGPTLPQITRQLSRLYAGLDPEGPEDPDIESSRPRFQPEEPLTAELQRLTGNIDVNETNGTEPPAPAPVFSAIVPVEQREYYPATSAQQRLFTLYQFHRDQVNYNMPSAVLIEGELSVPRLEATAEALIRRHESFRTSFHVIQDQLVQRVHDRVEFRCQTLGSRPDAPTLFNFVRPFDLSLPPLLRIGLIRGREQRHILVYDMHHIISDGTSRQIFALEFSQLYLGLQLEPLTIQYKDFSAWRNKEFQSPQFLEQQRYWHQQFRGRLPILNLPPDRPRPPFRTVEGETLGFQLDETLTAGLLKLASHENATLFIVLLSITTILLSRYSGQEDIIVGTPAEGRAHVQLQNIVGMFVNTLALRNNPQPHITFSAFLETVKNNFLGAIENQDYQFDQLVDHLDLDRDVSRNPLFDVMLLLQNMEDRGARVRGLTIKPYQLENQISHFDLTIGFIQKGLVLTGSMEYNVKLFKPGTIQRMISHFTAIATEVVKIPGVTLDAINLLSPQEKQRILEEFNDTSVDYPKDKTLVHLLQEQADRTPNQTALTDAGSGSHLTYSQLNRQAGQLAQGLVERGIKPDGIVAIMMERSIEMVIGLVGILKAGGAYLPIDPDYPDERVRYMLEDSNAVLCMTDSSGNGKNNDQLSIINYQLLMKTPALPEPCNLNPANLAYLIYTSGSTGKPKGTMIQHEGICNRLCWMRDSFPLTPNHRVLQKTPYSFDISVWEFSWPLIAGASLVLAKPGGHKDGSYLVEVIVNHHITAIHFVPGMLGVFLEVPGIQHIQSLKWVICSGEALLFEHLERFFHRFPRGVELHNLYGPTEASVEVTAFQCLPNEEQRNVPIGRPIANTRIYILDPRLNPVPVGVHGQLYIAGIQLARGYLNQPGLTAERFLRWDHADHETIYKTGDVARWLPDGNIEFIGRLDHQVKIRGNRVELGEIESCLLSFPGIKETVVTVITGDNRDNVLAAYVVAAGEEAPDESSLRDHLSRQLPGYMIPTFFVPLETIPLTPSGKVDRKALPIPGSKPTAAYSAPRNPVEEKLVELWSQSLGKEQEEIGIDDHFFKLGGHSLKAIILVTAIEKAFRVNVPLPLLFREPTIRRLSQYITTGDAPVIPKPEAVENREYYPLSAAQFRLFTIHLMEENSTSYNIMSAFTLEGPLKRDLLESALNRLVHRHEVLRTAFLIHDETPVQRVLDQVEFEVKSQEHSEEDQEYARLAPSFSRPFDLRSAPLMRVKLHSFGSFRHFLLFDIHHIISDGASMSILVREFSQLYAGMSLAPPALQYKDYTMWQHQVSATEDSLRQKHYWHKQFSGPLPVLNLPLDWPRPPYLTLAGETINFQLDETLTTGLLHLAAGKSATLFMVLLAITNILFYRYTGQEDIILGTPSEGRAHGQLRNIIGMFINTLALRNNPLPLITFNDFLDTVKNNFLGALENQDYQFHQLVNHLDLDRDVNRNPLFDVMLLLQNIENRETQIKELTIKPYQLENKSSHFDLTLGFTEKGPVLAGSIEYNVKLFKPGTIRRMIAHFTTIATQVTRTPDVTLSAVNLLSPEEKEKILVEFNDTSVDYPKDKTLVDLLDEQAKRTPNQTALTDANSGCHLTYGQLNRQAGQLARGLVERGVKPDGIAAIMMERSVEMVIGLLGILKAGGAYLPIDPDYPQERIDFMLKDSGAILCISNDWEKGKNNDRSEPAPCTLNPANLAYLLYTSGSTGKPKGTMIAHAGICNRLFWMQDYFRLTTNDRVLQKTPYGFDVSVWEFFWPLITGAQLVMAKPGGHKDGSYLAEVIVNHRITTLHFVPGMLGVFLDVPGIQRISTLKRVICSGEALPSEYPERFYRHFPRSVELHNLYGPTEASVDVTAFRCLPDKEQRSIPIGRPIANTRIYILDNRLNPVPVGVHGELYIAGVQLARGYLNQPGLTAQRFLSWHHANHETVYKTGDVARWLPDGNIEFIGRLDHQVKIRGNRVELGEIENCLLSFPGIKETVVTAITGDNSDTVLAAYIVASSEEAPNETSLTDHLSRKLPDYMVPTYFIPLETIPLTPNGKIDRNALPIPGLKPGAVYSTPRDPMEEKLVELWSQSLGIEPGKIGIDHHFFKLGGHSLRAIILVTAIEKAFGVNVPLPVLFREPSIRRLARYITTADASVLPKLEAVEKRDYYPLSAAQFRLFTVHLMEKDSTNYNMMTAFTLEGPLEKDRLDHALNRLVQRHGVLRTAFLIHDGTPVQRVLDPVEFKVESREYEAEEDIDYDGLIRSFSRPFDLGAAPLMRVELHSFGSNRHFLLFDIHHIISDGTSMSILVSEFSQLYEGLPLAPPVLQYSDYTLWQHKISAIEGSLEKSEAYWLERFRDGVPMLEMPLDFPRPPQQSFEGDHIFFSADENLTRRLNQFTTQSGTTLFMVLLTAYNILLLRYTSQQDMVVGCGTANRQHADLQDMVGMFVNMLVMRNTPSPQHTFNQLLEDVKTNAIQAFEHQAFQFDSLVEKLNIERDPSRNPVFDVAFIVQNMEAGEFKTGNLHYVPHKSESRTSKFDFFLAASEEDNGTIRFALEYCTKLFKTGTMARLSRHYLNVLTAIIQTDGNTLPGEIDLLTPEERKQLLEEFNNTTTPVPHDKSIHLLFEEQVERTPDSIAVMTSHASITYNHLNRLADQSAQGLIERGVKPGGIVGIMMEQSIQMIICILGVLKLGGAYLPIDQDYPKERIDFMLKDSGAGILLRKHSTEYQYSSRYQDHLPTFPPSNPSNLAYIIYTSGTTGKPKGVMVEHRNAVAYIHAFYHEFDITYRDVFLQQASFSFDVFVEEVYPILLKGGKLAIAQKDIILDMQVFHGFLVKQGVTVISCSPLLLNQVDKFPDTGSIRIFINGGDVLKPDYVRNLLNQGRVYNTYGPTETTVCATYYHYRDSGDEQGDPPIGKPIANYSVYIRDQFRQLTPIGIPGELCIAGPGVSRGYMNRPELTNEKFEIRTSQFTLYKTGDLARWSADGNIQFLGRIDQQVKIRGYRIEPGEIENRLVQHEEVKEAIVTVRQSDDGDKYLCAYFVSNVEIPSRDLRKHLEAELPDYMIPSHFVRLDTIPLTPNGKINRRALPAPQAPPDHIAVTC
ncbi:MAG: amino acid adenylation domain-containing protein, partial [bacterium]|nr:amino acid adenylation domain-containing protein [bacterium]